jgi:cysteinyl-tRNA synthetase
MELVDQRSSAKDAKDWELADSLRARITELGFAVKDVKGGDPIVSRLD